MPLPQFDWTAIGASLDEFGCATTPALVSPDGCAELIAEYTNEARFRSRVDMGRYRFGSGEYKYFARPLPAIVDELRTDLYPLLATTANRWAERIGGPTFPRTLEAFLGVCGQQGQTKPTPLLLRYGEGDYNCLHQDLYGEIAFPLQVTIALSRRDDYGGGEFLLLEQRPRAQSAGQAVNLEQGEAIVFATRHRPVRGSRGYYRATMRHGVSRVTSGQRYTLGIIFHDAA